MGCGSVDGRAFVMGLGKDEELELEKELGEANEA